MLSTEHRDEIERRALEITAILDGRAQKLIAEIDPSERPAWYVITIKPDCEAKAMRHLLRRCFGIFDPTFDEWTFSRGRKRIKRSRLFPGYLLVFVWMNEDQWSRITSTPGVDGILCRAATGKPVVIPDAMVSYLQGLETTESLNATRPGWDSQEKLTRKQKKSKRRKNGSLVREPEPPPMLDEGPDIVIRCKSYFSGIEELAPDKRISAFKQAIGLA